MNIFQKGFHLTFVQPQHLKLCFHNFNVNFSINFFLDSLFVVVYRCFLFYLYFRSSLWVRKFWLFQLISWSSYATTSGSWETQQALNTPMLTFVTWRWAGILASSIDVFPMSACCRNMSASVEAVLYIYIWKWLADFTFVYTINITLEKNICTMSTNTLAKSDWRSNPCLSYMLLLQIEYYLKPKMQNLCFFFCVKSGITN